MALQKCPECGGTVSDKAHSCPHCGYTDVPRLTPAAAAFINRRAWGFEWKSKTRILGMPLVCVAVGRDPNTAKLRVAKGFIAIGQFAIGVITIAQFGVGLICPLCQVGLGLAVIGQVAITALFGLGQFAVGYVAIGQMAVGVYVLAQVGAGVYAWTPEYCHPAAYAFFIKIKTTLLSLF